MKIEQTNIFDFIEETNKKYNIIKPIRLIELFAGIGSQAKALKNIGADLEIVDINKYCYIMTYSFPCQDLSLAGKQAGMTKGSSTRSGLLWEVERLLNETKELPQILLMENVPQVHGKKNIQDFEKWIEFLQSKGYSNYWQDLNAKDYGIPQNRNRTFMVSILGSYEYDFPKPFELKLRLKDMLEENVDEKYYLSDKNITKIINSSFAQEKNRIQTKETCDTILARDYKDPKCIVEFNNKRLNKIFKEKEIEPYDFLDCYNQQIKKDISGTIKTTISSSNMHFITEPDSRNMNKTSKLIQVGELDIKGHNSLKRVFSPEGLAPTIDTMQGGQRQPKIVIKANTKKGYAEAEEGDSLNLTYPNSTTRRGRVGKQLSQTLETSCNQAVVEKGLRIRKLTPKECWRLMGFADEDFDNASKLNSNSQLYKQAGNSIVVNVLEEIFKQFFKE